MDFEGLKDYVFELLEKGLSSDLVYHDVAHTKDIVLPAAMRLCDLERISGDDKILIMSAAVLHDVGYLKRYDDNEVLAVEMAKEILPKFGYGDSEILRICEMIMATKMPQSPKNLFSEILCDADLSNLGGVDFVELSKKYREEFEICNEKYTDNEWNQKQIDFLKNHKYFTKSAKKLWNEQKEKNIDFYIQKIKS